MTPHIPPVLPGTMDLTELDANLDDLEHIFALTSECGFNEIIADMIEEIRSVMMPDLARLLLLCQDRDRAAVALRQFRLQTLLDRALVT